MLLIARKLALIKLIMPSFPATKANSKPHSPSNQPKIKPSFRAMLLPKKVSFKSRKSFSNSFPESQLV